MVPEALASPSKLPKAAIGRDRRGMINQHRAKIRSFVPAILADELQCNQGRAFQFEGHGRTQLARENEGPGEWRLGSPVQLCLRSTLRLRQLPLSFAPIGREFCGARRYSSRRDGTPREVAGAAANSGGWGTLACIMFAVGTC